MKTDSRETFFAASKFIGGVILVIVVLAAIFTWQHTSDISGIETAIYPEKIVEAENMYFGWGPFNYAGKANRVYKVKTEKNVYWYRTGFSPDLYKEIGEGKYQQIIK